MTTTNPTDPSPPTTETSTPLSPFQERWVKALESGEYQQGVGRLYRAKTDSYCCLGVLCKVYNVSTEGSTLESGYHPQGLLKEVMGFSSKSISTLVKYNDCDRLPFKEIARLIRDNPKLYFPNASL